MLLLGYEAESIRNARTQAGGAVAVIGSERALFIAAVQVGAAPVPVAVVVVIAAAPELLRRQRLARPAHEASTIRAGIAAALLRRLVPHGGHTASALLWQHCRA